MFFFYFFLNEVLGFETKTTLGRKHNYFLGEMKQANVMYSGKHYVTYHKPTGWAP